MQVPPGLSPFSRYFRKVLKPHRLREWLLSMFLAGGRGRWCVLVKEVWNLFYYKVCWLIRV